jgi:hypothetical protein
MYLEGLVNLLSAHTATALPFDVVQSAYVCLYRLYNVVFCTLRFTSNGSLANTIGIWENSLCHSSSVIFTHFLFQHDVG